MLLVPPNVTKPRPGAFRPWIWHWSWKPHPAWMPDGPAKNPDKYTPDWVVPLWNKKDRFEEIHLKEYTSRCLKDDLQWCICIRCQFQVFTHHKGSDSNLDLVPVFPDRLLDSFVQYIFFLCSSYQQVLLCFIVRTSQWKDFIPPLSHSERNLPFAPVLLNYKLTEAFSGMFVIFISKLKLYIFSVLILMFHRPTDQCIECLPIVWETGVQSNVESYQILKTWYLMLPCLTLSIIRYGSRVKCSNPGNRGVPSPTPRCSS